MKGTEKAGVKKERRGVRYEGKGMGREAGKDGMAGERRRKEARRATTKEGKS